MASSRVLTLSDEDVRDKRLLVVGDVHGCYDEMIDLFRLIDIIDVDNAIRSDTLVVFVGDLVNKGPHSARVLEFVMNNRPSALSVRGNHEDNCLDGKFDSTWRPSEPQCAYMRSLPYVIRIPSYHVIVVHAGLINGLSLEQQSVKTMTKMRNVIVTADGRAKPYKETDKGVHWAGLWRGEEHVIFGHDARRGMDASGAPCVQRFDYATGLDTRCVKGGELTAMELSPERGRVYSVKAKHNYEKR